MESNSTDIQWCQQQNNLYFQLISISENVMVLLIYLGALLNLLYHAGMSLQPSAYVIAGVFILSKIISLTFYILNVALGNPNFASVPDQVSN